MSDDSLIKSPGIDSQTVWAIQNSPRALISKKFYSVATGIKNKAGALVGFALTKDQLEDVLSFEKVKGKDIARAFFNQYAQDSGSSEVGKFLMVGTEIDIFFDLLAAIGFPKHFQKSNEIITPSGKIKAEDINKKEEGRRW